MILIILITLYLIVGVIGFIIVIKSKHQDYKNSKISRVILGSLLIIFLHPVVYIKLLKEDQS